MQTIKGKLHLIIKYGQQWFRWYVNRKLNAIYDESFGINYPIHELSFR